MNHPLTPLLQCPGVHVHIIVRHTGDVDDTESVRLAEHRNDPGTIELCDGLYTCHEREPDSDMKILRRLNLGQLSGTHVFHRGCGQCTSSGFATWHLEIQGDTPKPS